MAEIFSVDYPAAFLSHLSTGFEGKQFYILGVSKALYGTYLTG